MKNFDIIAIIAIWLMCGLVTGAVVYKAGKSVQESVIKAHSDLNEILK